MMSCSSCRHNSKAAPSTCAWTWTSLTPLVLRACALPAGAGSPHAKAWRSARTRRLEHRGRRHQHRQPSARREWHDRHGSYAITWMNGSCWPRAQRAQRSKLSAGSRRSMKRCRRRSSRSSSFKTCRSNRQTLAAVLAAPPAKHAPGRSPQCGVAQSLELCARPTSLVRIPGTGAHQTQDRDGQGFPDAQRATEGSGSNEPVNNCHKQHDENNN